MNAAIEKALDYSIVAAAHDAAYLRAMRRHCRARGERARLRAHLEASGHYWAAKWNNEAADNAWACVRYDSPPVAEFLDQNTGGEDL